MMLTFFSCNFSLAYPFFFAKISTAHNFVFLDNYARKLCDDLKFPRPEEELKNKEKQKFTLLEKNTFSSSISTSKLFSTEFYLTYALVFGITETSYHIFLSDFPSTAFWILSYFSFDCCANYARRNKNDILGRLSGFLWCRSHTLSLHQLDNAMECRGFSHWYDNL